MRPTKIQSGLLGLALTATLTFSALAGTLQFNGVPTGSFCKIEGTSTIHDWTMESKLVAGSMEADEGFPASALTKPEAAKPTVKVNIPVRTFKSYAKKMDEVMQEHMNVTKHPRIEYQLIELKPKSAAGSTGALAFDAVGVLTVNGTPQTNSMPVTIEKLSDGKLKVVGGTPLKMTDFNVKPPAPTIMGMSMIKTGDEIKVNFEFLAAPKAQ